MPLPLLGSVGRAPGNMPPAMMAAPSVPVQPQPQPQSQPQQLLAQPHTGVAPPLPPQRPKDNSTSGAAKRKADAASSGGGAGGGGGDSDAANKRPATGAAPAAGSAWLQY